MADLPTRDELRRLPRWARVAYAARCARRVQPLFSAQLPNAPEKHSTAMEEAITIAERSAAYAYAYTYVADAADATDADVAADTYALAAAEYADDAYAYGVAYTAAYAAADGANAAVYGVPDVYACAAASALRAAARMNVGDWMKDAVKCDFDFLVRAAGEGAWDDSTPVPPEFFGRLWPKGEPPGWPVKEASSADRELVVEIDVPADASDEDLIRTVCELADQADTLHRAYGGRGLQVNDVEVFDEAHVREGVPA